MQAFWLAAYDLRMQLRERGTGWLLGVALALALFALWQGERFRSQTLAAIGAAQAQEDAARKAASAEAAVFFAQPHASAPAGFPWYRSPVDVRGYAYRAHLAFAVKPPLAGSALAIGQADVLPSYVRVKAESLDSVRTAAEIEHPGQLATGRFDLLFFVVTLWPLLLLALGTPVLAQDREAGRLRVLRVQGVRVPVLLAAQVLARCGAATLALAAVVVAAAPASGAVPATAAGLQALLAWSGIVLAYSLFWAGVTAAVCSLCQTRMTAAFAGFGAWLVLAVLLPAVLAAGAQWAVPLPSRESSIVAARDAADAIEADRVQLLGQYYDEHPQWRPRRTGLDKLPASATRLLRAAEQERRLAPVVARLDAARRRQREWMRRWSVASPASAAHEALSRVAGNDVARHELFIAEVERFQSGLRDYFQAAIQQAALRAEDQACASTCADSWGFQDFNAVPIFRPAQPPGL